MKKKSDFVGDERPTIYKTGIPSKMWSFLSGIRQCILCRKYRLGTTRSNRQQTSCGYLEDLRRSSHIETTSQRDRCVRRSVLSTRLSEQTNHGHGSLIRWDWVSVQERKN